MIIQLSDGVHSSQLDSGQFSDLYFSKCFIQTIKI